MTLKTRPVLRVFSLFLLLLLLVNVFPMQSLAADTVYEGEIELTGKFSGKFSLDSSSMELFNLKDIVPGDTWKGKLHVHNTAKGKMEFAILSIVSNLQDNTLYNALDLTISLNSEEIYNGSYGSTEEPITEFYRLDAGEKITFDIDVTLPKTAGNELQNKEMDSTWTFEARYYGGGSGDKYVKYSVHYVDEDGNALLEPKGGWGLNLRTVREKAPDIDGYTPDAKEKKLVLNKKKENKIVFVYSPNTIVPPIEPDDPEPIEPSDPEPIKPEELEPVPPSEEVKPPAEPSTPEKPTKSPAVPTGFDLSGSNSVGVISLFVLALCLLGCGVTFLRIRAEKAKTKSANSKSKEASANAKK